ncbi:MAG: hypothetical protein AB1646_25940 [Thermodesulfobacteriota bacterium]
MKPRSRERIAVFAVIGLLILAPLSIPAAVHGQQPPATKTEAATAPKVHKGFVLLVEFPDVPHRVDKDLVRMRFSQHLNAYVQEMSYQKAALSVDVTKKWHTLPRPIAEYRISSRNLEVDRSRIRRLIDDSLAAVDQEVDFSRYDFVAIVLAAEVQDYGMIGLCGYPGMLGWSSEAALKTKSGRRIKGGVAIFCFRAHLGTLFHDVAHILGGVKDGKRMVPCLYDHDLQARPGPRRETFVKATINMGFWDPMSCHFYRWGVPPPGISSWTKLRLNWIDESKVKVIKPREMTEFVLGPLEDGSSEVLVARIPEGPHTYYLIENRQPIGFDAVLPGSGVLIMYADDSVPECRRGRAPVKLWNANPSVPNLEGAAYDVGSQEVILGVKFGPRVQIKEKVGNSYRIVVGFR